MSGEALLSDEGPSREREGSGFPQSTQAPCPHCPHPRARGAAACAVVGRGMWRGRKCSCVWKRRRVANGVPGFAVPGHEHSSYVSNKCAGL